MRRARIESAVAMAYTAHSVLARLKEKVAKLSSSAVTARTRSRELEDAWERINELCKERGAQARAGLHSTVPDWSVAAAREKAGGAPPCFFVPLIPSLCCDRLTFLQEATIRGLRREQADMELTNEALRAELAAITLRHDSACNRKFRCGSRAGRCFAQLEEGRGCEYRAREGVAPGEHGCGAAAGGVYGAAGRAVLRSRVCHMYGIP